MDETRAPHGKHLWLVNLFFDQSMAPTGALLESLAIELHERGFQVDIITGRSGYLARGSTKRRNRFLGRVHRIYSGPASTHSFSRRLTSWMFFYFGVVWFVFSRPLPSQVVVMTTPPLLHAIFALRNLLARRKAKLILWNQDTYPEILQAVGLAQQKSMIYQVLSKLSTWSAAHADKIIALDEAMKETFHQRGIHRVQVIPNWDIPLPSRENNESPKDLDLSERLRHIKQKYRYLVLYTGNYGWGHDLRILFHYLLKNPWQRNFFFLFVGGGQRWNELVRLNKQHRLECMDVISYLPQASLQMLFEAADFGLVVLNPSCVGLMSPSKIHRYLAFGTPLIYIGPEGSNVAEAVETYHCGFRIDHDDRQALERCFHSILADHFDYNTLVQKALHASSSRYCQQLGLQDVCALIQAGEESPGED